MLPNISKAHESGICVACDQAALKLEIENAALRREVAKLRTYADLAYRDHLTGLHNRRYYNERITEEINRTRRNPEYTFSILIIDINDFKRINDEHGHAVGDQTLKWLSGYLKNNIRLDDICCRLAGDEFILLLPNTDAESHQHLVNRLRRCSADARRQLDMPVTLSIGTATFRQDGTSAQSLFETADAAMYHDKRRQKNALFQLSPEQLIPDRFKVLQPA